MTAGEGHNPYPDTRMNRCLVGARVLVLNWRDIRHPQAGGAEQYMHQTARRWAAAGARVSWIAARPQGLPAHERVDGIDITRVGGPLTLYVRAALLMLARRRRVDYVVDCQNGIPYFSPLFLSRRTTIVQLVHHIHQDQFATRFGPLLTSIGQFMEGRAARRVYGNRSLVAVSPSTRHGLRRRLGFRGPIHIVANGTEPAPVMRGPRDLDPTITVVSRLVPHKRIELLLEQLVSVRATMPNLRVNVVGDGPERRGLEQLSARLGLRQTVRFHGYLPAADRDELLNRAWLTCVTSASEGWGCSVVEAAARGVPTVALDVDGIRDSVIDGRTGWLVAAAADLGTTIVAVLDALADDAVVERVTAACQGWAAGFTWDRSASLLSHILVDAGARRPGRRDRRSARSDIATVVRFAVRPGSTDEAAVRSLLRMTDQVVVDDGRCSILLFGCDETDASCVLRRLGVRAEDAEARLADRYDLLLGPAGMPFARDERPVAERRT